MRAHKLEVTIPNDRELAIRLPDDFPTGPAEVIILSNSSSLGPPDETPRAPVPHPVLGKISFHEDPSLPLDPEDWKES